MNDPGEKMPPVGQKVARQQSPTHCRKRPTDPGIASSRRTSSRRLKRWTRSSRVWSGTCRCVQVSAWSWARNRQFPH